MARLWTINRRSFDLDGTNVHDCGTTGLDFIRNRAFDGQYCGWIADVMQDCGWMDDYAGILHDCGTISAPWWTIGRLMSDWMRDKWTARDRKSFTRCYKDIAKSPPRSQNLHWKGTILQNSHEYFDFKKLRFRPLWKISNDYFGSNGLDLMPKWAVAK
jgi:hypothetical protein